MSITFPRAWPACLPIVGLSFPLEPMIEITPLRSGRQISADLGPSLWKPKYQSAVLRADKFGEARAWYTTLLSAEAFLGFDILRQYPLAYKRGWPSAFVGFDGTCVLEDVTNAKVMDLSGLPAGFTFSPGDYLAFDYSSGASRALHRVVAGDVADGAGLAEIEVRPFVRSGWAADAVVSLYRPSARFIILPGTYSESMDFPPGTGSLSFEAIQTL